jgi:hypothetical protein
MAIICEWIGWTELFSDLTFSMMLKGSMTTITSSFPSHPYAGPSPKIAHSAANSIPELGYARDRTGGIYGIVDIKNRIVYNTASGPTSDSPVEAVTYLSPTAPVLEWASGAQMKGGDAASLLIAAKNAALYSPTAKADNSPPCIGFSGDRSDDITNQARSYLETAVTLSGDFRFTEDVLQPCWTVSTVVMPLENESGYSTGYVISYALLDSSGQLIDHGLQVGPDRNVLDHAMREAAADFAKHVRSSK